MGGFASVKRFIRAFEDRPDPDAAEDRTAPHGPDADQDADEQRKQRSKTHTRGGSGGMQELKDAMEATPGGDTRKNKRAY